MGASYSIDELRDIVSPLVSDNGLRSASLFGSHARGDAGPTSDIDILVDKGDKPFLNVFAFAEDVHRATERDVDIFDITELLEGDFRDAVLREAIALC